MKEEFDRIEEVDKLAEGLRGLGPEFEAGTLKNTPQHRIWKRALNKLPKKEKMWSSKRRKA